MHRGTPESDFVRNAGTIVAAAAVLFAAQGIIFPPVSLVFGMTIFFGRDLILLIHIVGGLSGMFSLIAIKKQRLNWERTAFAFMCWFYITFSIVVILLVGLQAPSILFGLVTVLISGGVYAYTTERMRQDASFNSSSDSKNRLWKGLSGINPSLRHDKRRFKRDNIRP